jgi:hypothetical protein
MKSTKEIETLISNLIDGRAGHYGFRVLLPEAEYIAVWDDRASMAQYVDHKDYDHYRRAYIDIHMPNADGVVTKSNDNRLTISIWTNKTQAELR